VAEADALHAKIPFRIKTPLAQAVYSKLLRGAPLPTGNGSEVYVPVKRIRIASPVEPDCPAPDDLDDPAPVAAVVARIVAALVLIAAGLVAVMLVARRRRTQLAHGQSRVSAIKVDDVCGSVLKAAPSTATYSSSTATGADSWPTKTHKAPLHTGGLSTMTKSPGPPSVPGLNLSECSHGAACSLSATTVPSCAPKCSMRSNDRALMRPQCMHVRGAADCVARAGRRRWTSMWARHWTI
jgi:hypothetical protein